MTRSRLRSKNDKNCTYGNWSSHKSVTLLICRNILKKVQTDYFNNIDIKIVTGSKRAWTAVKPFCTDKSKTYSNIILNENDKALKDCKEITNKFNRYFVDIVKKQNLKKDTGTSFESQEICRMIKTKVGKENFSFEVFTEAAVVNAINNLPAGKACVSTKKFYIRRNNLKVDSKVAGIIVIAHLLP